MDHVSLAEHARAAYQDQNTITLAHDLEFAVYANVIAIRGSELDLSDWGRNLMAFPWKCGPVGMAPFGFARGAKRIVKFLQRRNVGIGLDLDFPIFVTGHSAGGAMAILVAEYLATMDWPVAECVAFAAPKTGERQLAVPTTIYDHAGDLVCDVPPLWGHPVSPVRLPDVSDGPLQHAMDHYVAAVKLLRG